MAACEAPSEPASTAAPAVEKPARPNLIVILADDIGVETVGAYGSEYSTPRIDAIGANGIRFDAAFATPICTPSRVRLLTGRYSYRNYVDFSVLAPGETTVAQRLRAAGYRTLVAGKWQLAGTGDADDPPGTAPEDAGFDEHLVWHMERENKGSRYWGPRLRDDGAFTDYPDDEFGPDIVNRRVLDFIARQGEQPFFVYYSMLLAHKPWVTTPISRDAESDRERFIGMMGYMDLLVGRLLDALDSGGLTHDTLVFFIGDNGTHPDITSLRNGVAVQGGKWKTSDAGLHVPFLAQWPGRIPAGGSSGELVDLIDVAPTLLEAAGLPPAEETDGLDLMPQLAGTGNSGREWIFMHFDPHQDLGESFAQPARFLFTRDWKLYSDGRFYDLRNDWLELNPIEVRAPAAGDSGDDAFQAYRELSGLMERFPPLPFHRDAGEVAPDSTH
jgi:arylsulfatase A